MARTIVDCTADGTPSSRSARRRKTRGGWDLPEGPPHAGKGEIAVWEGGEYPTPMLSFPPNPRVGLERKAMIEWYRTPSAAEVAAAQEARARLLRGLLYGGAGSAILWLGLISLVSSIF